MRRDRVSKRLFLLPCAALATAGLIMVWSNAHRHRLGDEAREMIQALLGAVAHGEDPGPALRATDPLLRRPLLGEIGEALGDGGLSGIVVRVEAGDAGAPRPGPGRATHTALLEREGDAVLGLRVNHPGDSGGIAIIGFWRP